MNIRIRAQRALGQKSGNPVFVAFSDLLWHQVCLPEWGVQSLLGSADTKGLSARMPSDLAHCHQGQAH